MCCLTCKVAGGVAFETAAEEILTSPKGFA